jgi:hypothetical protein
MKVTNENLRIGFGAACIASSLMSQVHVYFASPPEKSEAWYGAALTFGFALIVQYFFALVKDHYAKKGP